MSFGVAGKTSSTFTVPAVLLLVRYVQRRGDDAVLRMTSPSRSISTCANAGPATSTTTPVTMAPTTASLRIMMLLSLRLCYEWIGTVVVATRLVDVVHHGLHRQLPVTRERDREPSRRVVTRREPDELHLDRRDVVGRLAQLRRDLGRVHRLAARVSA